jgi:S-adenosyl-L-methionine hydrolase (adenosine-forming)
LPLPISFLSDYGWQDEFVGVCHGVIQTIAAGATVIDIAHGLEPGELTAAAAVLRNALPYMPAGVHLAVVDPGVGTERRALVLRCGERLLVGPDNGLLWPASERLGGVDRAIDVSDSPWRLEAVSATFHGRDVFAPVAARLAIGASLDEAGEEIDRSQLARLELPRAQTSDGALSATVLLVDRFGNAQLGATAEDLAAAGLAQDAPVAVEAGANRGIASVGRTFADGGPQALLVYEDSSRSIALAVNGGNAARLLDLKPGTTVRLTRATE